MEKNKYLKLCCAVSLLPSGVFGIKKNVPKNLRVVFDGIEYYPVSYVVEFLDGVAVQFAQLHDLEANSTRREELSRVEAVEEEGDNNGNKGD